MLNAQGEFLDAYLVNGKAFPPRVVFIDPDPADPSGLTVPPRVGRHVNGKLCFLPRKVSRRREFVLADDTYREACLDSHPSQARCGVTVVDSSRFGVNFRRLLPAVELAPAVCGGE